MYLRVNAPYLKSLAPHREIRVSKVLYCLYDPLCGWCYGATPAISELAGISNLTVNLLPTGLFAADRAALVDDEFAATIWSIDQRIERTTGQRFSDDYRLRVLGDRQQLLDSGPATLALTAVSLTAPARELEVLKGIQRARYVNGSDVTSPEMLANLLVAFHLKEAAARIARPDLDLLDANLARIERAQALMREFGAQGVPTLVAESGARRWMLKQTAGYSNPRALIDQLDAACTKQ
jgi:putative protein-disulfide isomerase